MKSVSSELMRAVILDALRRVFGTQITKRPELNHEPSLAKACGQPYEVDARSWAELFVNGRLHLQMVMLTGLTGNPKSQTPG